MTNDTKALVERLRLVFDNYEPDAHLCEMAAATIERLERELAEARRVPRMSRFATPQMVAVVRNANPWLTSSSVIHEWWTMMYDAAMKGASDE